MYKKTIALLCALLMLTVAFSACEKHSRYGKVIEDVRGMEHIVMTDKKGVTVCDENGNLIEIMTGSDGKPLPAVTENGTAAERQEGEYQTNSLTFPYTLHTTKKIVEDQFCKITLPDGWKSMDESRIILEQESTGAQIIISTETEQMASGILEGIQADCDKMGVTYTPDESQIDGVPAHILRYTAIGTDFIAYALNLDAQHAMSIICTAAENTGDQIDFDAVLQGMQIK